MTIYWVPKLPGFDIGYFRLGGPGLGNLLFPWARALIGHSVAVAEQRLHGTDNRNVFIEPVWRQLKVGPLVRRESDSRTYWSTFSPTSTVLQRSRELWRLRSVQQLSENEVSILSVSREQRDLVVVFEGLANQFADLIGANSLIRQRLLSSTSVKVLEEVASAAPGALEDIAVHIRLGDFTRPESQSARNTASNTSTPIRWFKHAIQRITKMTRPSEDLQFSIFSDGTAAELSPILDLPMTRLIRTQSALASILAISQRSRLIASGSTFGMWGAYLGNLPCIYFPGQKRQGVHFGRIQELEMSESDLDSDLLMQFLKPTLPVQH